MVDRLFRYRSSVVAVKTLGLLSVMIYLGGVVSTCLSADAMPAGYLIRDGQCEAVLVPQNDSDGVQHAVHTLQTHLERATGLALPVVEPAEAESLPADRLRVVIGFGPTTEMLGIANDLALEAYRVVVRDNHLVFVGHDNPYGEPAGTSPDGLPLRRLDGFQRRGVDGARATQWAVTYFLDHHLGVRWLWPGVLGTYVPKHRTIEVPALDVQQQPDVKRRMLRVNLEEFRGRQEMVGAIRLLNDDAHHQVLREARSWLARHRMGLGRLTELDFTHSFGQWWGRYHETHSDIFAKTPAGQQQPYPRKRDVKLCVSNEKVDRFVIEEWRAAGAPDTWPIALNDLGGFCICADCRAMDGLKYSEDEVWNGSGNLSGRYVRFWNRLLAKMRQINPNVRLTGLAYTAAKNAPPEGIRIETPGAVILSFVHYYGDEGRANWLGWHEAGAQLQLRPNWWHAGGPSPHLHFRPMGRFFRFARQNSMFGFDFDELQGNWATEGFNYYMVARLSYRPELSVDDILAEYTAAFGTAAPAIRDYLNYWHGHAVQTGFRIDGVRHPEGQWESLMKDERWKWGAGLFHTWYGMPFLFTDGVLSPAYKILDEAARLASGDDAQVQARIAFLRDGLKHLELTREVFRHAYPHLRPDGHTPEQFEALIDELYQVRSELTPRHVIWGEILQHHEARRGYPPAGNRVE